MKHLSISIVLIASVCLSCQENRTARLDDNSPSVERNAFDSINNLIKATPNNPALYFERAQWHYDQRDLAASMNDVGRALKLDSSNTDYYLLLADLKILAKESREARDALLKAYQINPNDIDVLLRLGELYMIVQDAEASFRYLNEALKIDVYNADAYRLKGFNYKFLGDTVNAVSSFQTAVEQNPDDYDSYMQLGLLYSSIEHDIALDYYNNALKVRPRSVEALYAKGLFLQVRNASRDALQTYETILDVTDSGYFDAWYNMGYVYLTQLQAYDSAAFYFTQAIANGPDRYVQAYYNRGLCYEQAGQLDKALADYKQALKFDPQYDLAARGVGRIVD